MNSTLGSIGNAAARKAVTLLGKYGINVLGETTEEGLQQSVSIANRNRVRRGEYNPDANWIERGWDLLTNSGETIREAVTDKDPDAAAEIWSAAKEGAKLAGMFGGPIAVAHGIAATPVITTQTREKSVQTSGEHDIINTNDAAENGTQAEQTAQAELAAQGEARLRAGEMPTPEQLRAMNLSEPEARGKMVMMNLEQLEQINAADVSQTEIQNISASDTERVTYRRVQGGIENKSSQQRVMIDDAGNVYIKNKASNLSLSIDNGEHSQYYVEKRRPGADIYEFDVPKWFDDIVQEFVLPQAGYRNNPLNQRRSAPKLADPGTPGKCIEFPAPWIEWIEEYATNGRIIRGGE